MAYVGHNADAVFDACVEGSLRRGFYASALMTVCRAIKDMTLGRRDLRTLVAVVERMSSEAGTCYPGQALIAEDTKFLQPPVRGADRETVTAGIENPAGGYAMSGTNKSLSELERRGFLVTKRQAPPGMKRALTHYAAGVPDTQDLHDRIVALVAKTKNRRAGPPQIQERFHFSYHPDVPHGEKAESPEGKSYPGEKVTPRDESQIGAVFPPVLSADFPPGHPADFPPSRPTVTSNGTGSGTGGRASAKPGRSDFWKGELNPTHRAAREQVSWGSDGRIQAAGDFRAELLAGAGDNEVELQRQLDQAVAYVGKHLTGYGLQQAVRSQLAKQRGWAAQRAATASGKVSAAPAPAQPADAVAAARARMISAMRQAFPVGGFGARPWPTHELGPEPGRPGCRLGLEDQATIWRSLLEAVQSDVPGYETLPAQRVGFAIYSRLRKWWNVDAASPTCPIPRDILAALHVPMTAKDVSAMEAAARAARAARATPAGAHRGHAENSRHTSP